MEEHFYEAVCTQMIFMIDEDHVLLPHNRRLGPMYCALQECKNRHEEVHRTSKSDPCFDFEFSLTLIPVGNITLGIYYAERGPGKTAIVLWMGQDGVHDYCYFKNTEVSEGISEEEWTRRGDLWEQALGDDPPNKRGYTMELFGPRGLPIAPTWEQISKYADSLSIERRIQHLEAKVKYHDGFELPEEFELPKITRELAMER